MRNHYPFEKPLLPYSFSSLEPYISQKTLQIHYGNILQGYIEKLNALLKNHEQLQHMTLEQLITISGRLPENIGVPLSRYAGGVYSHLLYFNSMTPDPKQRHDNELSILIEKSFGGCENFFKQFTNAANSVFGSGHAWLVYDSKKNTFAVIATPNQETPLTSGLYPLIALDLWEHAYYLMYYYKRVEYIGDWWNLVNWSNAGSLYRDYLEKKI